MYFILYLLLALNILQGTIAYIRGDLHSVWHAVVFFLVSLLALGLVRLAHEAETKGGPSDE